MGAKSLPALADAPETTAFRQLVKVLQGDVKLKSLGASWSVWDGSPTDQANPSLTQLPYIQLTPNPGATGWAEESMHRSNFQILVGLAVAGTNADDMINLWGAIRSALFPPQATARRTEVETALNMLLVKPELTSQPFSVQTTDSGARMLWAVGTITFKLDINT